MDRSVLRASWLRFFTRSRLRESAFLAETTLSCRSQFLPASRQAALPPLYGFAIVVGAVVMVVEGGIMAVESVNRLGY